MSGPRVVRINLSPELVEERDTLSTERETFTNDTDAAAVVSPRSWAPAVVSPRSWGTPAAKARSASVPVVTPVTPTRAARNTSPHTLVVLDTGAYVPFPAVLGRSRRSDVVVDEPTVCRAHLRVAVDENGAPSVRCVGRKGAAEAACDGEVIAPGAAVPLRQGACISLGGAKFRSMQRPVTIFERCRLGKR